MKTFRVYYTGKNSRFKGFQAGVEADSERSAVEQVFALKLDDNYFPDDDGTIRDSDGDTLALPEDTCIKYDGGYFEAEEFSPNKQDYGIHQFMGEYFGICRDEMNGSGLVFGGDSACDDHYNRDYIESVYEKWDGRLSWDDRYGYQIETE